MNEFERLTPIASMQGENEEDTRLLKGLFAEATRFLKAHSWCREIEDARFAFGIGGVVAIFLFRIVPAGHSDDFLWLIVGDMPTHYLSPDEVSGPRAVMERYIRLMEDWIRAVRTGVEPDVILTVEVPTDEEHADLLAGRMDFLEREVLPLVPE
ncbi:MAG: hypothetical protein CSA62_08545 [Planctomycetota bacterium]|nr:MAG: hypothetical protein CSA62_08545 [Planctomycetota bacterium]